jgi:hypothetical protein
MLLNGLGIAPDQALAAYDVVTMALTGAQGDGRQRFVRQSLAAGRGAGQPRG